LRLKPGSYRLPVVRIETDRNDPPDLSADQSRGAVQEVAARLRQLSASGVQIDFDATRSQRRFYSRFLVELRAALGERVPISITALASWCASEPWFDDLPIDEAVPMLFRMGPDGAEIEALWQGRSDFRSRLCRQSLGLATDEPWPEPRPVRRLYVFSPRPWTPASVAEVLTRGVR
jgi:hypothetical protein